MIRSSDPAPVPSPCCGVCRLGTDGLCDGCGRTLREIADWTELDAEARAQVMERVRPWCPRGPAPGG